ncbi:unnamed protein product [Sphagnum balticum]
MPKLVALNLVVQGSDFFGEHKFYDALNAYTLAVKTDPDCSNGYMLRAMIYSFFLMDYERGSQDWTDFIRLNPHQALGYINRGEIKEKVRDYGAAVGDYTKAIQQEPTMVTAYNDRAHAYNSLGEYDKAIADCETSLKLGSLDDYGGAYLNRAVAEKWQNNQEACSKDLKAANEAFTQLIKKDANSSYAYLKRAQVLEEQGNFSAALQDLNHILAIIPENKEAHIARITVSLSARDVPGAIAYCNDAERIWKKDAHILCIRGSCYQILGDQVAALVDYTQAIDICPAYYEAVEGRAVAFDALGKFDKAIADYSLIAAKGSEKSHVYYPLGLCEFKAKDFKGAALNFDLAFASPSSQPNTRLYSSILGVLAFRFEANDKEAERLLNSGLAANIDCWPQPVLRYLKSELNEIQLLNLATDQDKLTEARSYIGLNNFQQKKYVEANESFAWVLAKGNKSFYEYALAKTFSTK